MRLFKKILRRDKVSEASSSKPKPRSWSFLAEKLAAEYAGQRRRSSSGDLSTSTRARAHSFHSAKGRTSETSAAATKDPINDGAASVSIDIESPPDDGPAPWSDLERLAWTDGRRRRSSILAGDCASPTLECENCYHLFREGKNDRTHGPAEVEVVWGRENTFVVDDEQIENDGTDLPIWRQQALRRWAMIRRVVEDGTYRRISLSERENGRPSGEADEQTFWGYLSQCCLTSLEHVGLLWLLNACYDRCRATWEERSLQHTVEKNALVFLSYITVGLAVYCNYEGWTTVGALYFIICTFTTVGFGELSPTNGATKVFTIFYSVAGIYMIGEVVGRGISRLMQSQIEKLEEIKRMNDKGVMDAFENGELEESRSDIGAFHWHGGDGKHDTEQRREKIDAGQRSDSMSSSRRSRPRPEWHRSMTNLSNVPESECECKTIRRIFTNSVSFFFSGTGPFFLWVIMQLIGVMFFVLKEGWSALDSIYWTVITSTTIGYGDKVPSTGARIFCIIFIPVFVTLTAHLLAKLAKSTLDRDVERKKEEMFQSRLLLEEDLTAMDTDGDGVVTRLEYIEFMLLSMGRVDKPTLERLHKMFDKLDADGSGTLEPEDLMLITRRKAVLEKTARNMKMEEYKNMLIAKGSMKKERRTNRFKVLVMSSTLQNLKRNSLLARIANTDD